MALEDKKKDKKFKLEQAKVYFGTEIKIDEHSIKPKKPRKSLKEHLIDGLNFKNSKWKDSKLRSKTINPINENFLEDVKDEFFNNKASVIVFSSLTPLLGNMSFVDYMVEKKIPFTSIVSTELSEFFSDSLIHLSDKKSLGRGGNILAGKNTKEPADEFALKLGPIINKLEEEGYTTLRAKADKLNTDKIKTLRGKSWVSSTVKRTYERWQRLMLEEEENNKNVIKISSSTNNASPSTPKP